MASFGGERGGRFQPPKRQQTLRAIGIFTTDDGSGTCHLLRESVVFEYTPSPRNIYSTPTVRKWHNHYSPGPGPSSHQPVIARSLVPPGTRSPSNQRRFRFRIIFIVYRCPAIECRQITVFFFYSVLAPQSYDCCVYERRETAASSGERVRLSNQPQSAATTGFVREHTDQWQTNRDTLPRYDVPWHSVAFAFYFSRSWSHAGTYWKLAIIRLWTAEWCSAKKSNVKKSKLKIPWSRSDRQKWKKMSKILKQINYKIIVPSILINSGLGTWLST